MNSSDRENLNELLAKFMDSEAAGRAAEDIKRGDELLRAHPAPQPDQDMIAGVKEMMSAVVKRRHRITLQRRILAVAAAAAVIVVISVAALNYFDRQPAGQTPVQYASVIPDRIWESSDITTDDADIAVLAAEISTIENELHGVELSDNDVSSMSVDDLEMELIGIGGDFWKG